MAALATARLDGVGQTTRMSQFPNTAKATH